MSSYAVVGAGPAGLTAALRLQQAGHRVQVFESESEVGGRTHAEHYGPNHWMDTGAGWLASFYPDTLALLDELGLRSLLSPMSLRGGGELQLDGRNVPAPNSVRRILTTDLLTVREKLGFFWFVARLFASQRGQLRLDRAHDDETALDALAGGGERARDRIVRPNFEGPFFARLEDMSGALVRSWLRCLTVGTFYHVDGGMDVPWRHIGSLLDVRRNTAVDTIEVVDAGVAITAAHGTETFDGVVVAVPAPLAVELVPDTHRPPWLADIRYVPHVRLYAARRSPSPPRTGVHAYPNDLVATVEMGPGSDGAWGNVPDDWQWALVCAPAATSGPLVDAPEEEVREKLWAEAMRLDPRLFPIESAEVVDLVRWRHAVPLVAPGYLRRIDGFEQRAPVVFAGDWLVQPCVEGAVRSGLAAAEVLNAAPES